MTSENNDDDIGGGSNESGEAPLWTYMTKKTKQGAKGRSWSFKFNRAALIQELEDESEKKKSESGARAVPLPWETSSVASSAFKKRKSSISPLERAFGIEVRDQLDQEIARMFYTGGLPFNLAGNPHYQRSFQFATDNKIDDYVLPGYNKLRTNLLHKERDHVEQLLEPVKLSWKEKGVSIVSDGWSDPTRKPLINFIATSENGPLFLKAVNCFGEVKDKFFISDLMKDVLNEVGHQNVAQIITVNATNYYQLIVLFAFSVQVPRFEMVAVKKIDYNEFSRNNIADQINSMQVMDNIGEAKLLLFDSICSEIVGDSTTFVLNGSVDEIEDPHNLPNPVKNLIGKTFLFLVWVEKENIFDGKEIYKVSKVLLNDGLLEEQLLEDSAEHVNSSSIVSGDQVSLMLENGNGTPDSTTPSSKRVYARELKNEDQGIAVDVEVVDSKEALFQAKKAIIAAVDKDKKKLKVEDVDVVKQEVKKDNSWNMVKVRVKVEKK
ncbi:hypothetical protein ISN45_At02g006750 [Arabidopsis thaliana x Arabidopsis arenosa]|uniref:DUF659 domain-containing protein n=1 Tax=Arabidopsis thaliana x Arabidopsis arenosa TaxID=1240361 RepID=A0A8T2FJ62_9BRAS|nr:hypothetical protein ISN45_At02g006750 [Arabidopsis thaliana x Arabidopsis arenosa]